MKIMTFNVQNKIKKEEEILEIVKLIKDEEPDIVGFQELTYNLKEKLSLHLKEYNFYGRSRLTLNTFFDEYNSLLIKKKLEIIETSTYSLGRNPYKIGSAKIGTLPRICTMALCVYNKKRIKIVNTHLENKNQKVKKYQLDVLGELLKNNSYPLILIGDFNMTSQNQMFLEFLKKMNLKDVTSSIGKTRLETEKDSPIDHVLISNELKVQDVKKMSDIFISDHFPVISIINF